MRKIVITGGEFRNKGAQSMVFICVSELHKRFPNHEIFVISDFYTDSKQEKIFCFNIRTFGTVVDVIRKNNLKQKIYYMIKGYDKKDNEKQNEFFCDVDLMIDISGYGLGDAWNKCEIEHYLYRIECAKYFGIKVYLMPQSFGPFKTFDKSLLKRTKKALEYASTIYAREQQGYDLLIEKFNLKNVKISYDLVLNNKSVDLNSVYKNIPMSCDFNVKTNSIAIIPNVRNSVVCSEKILLEAYKSLIDKFIVYGKNVYILRHSNSDIDICDKIFKIFHNNNVFLIEQESSCVEFSHIVNKFDFVVASRFHSVVHSYKNAVPCLTMGWAVKYLELHKLFHQEKYCFDVRNNFDISKLLSAAEDLLNNHSNQSEIISKELNQVQKHNIFDDINLEN